MGKKLLSIVLGMATVIVAGCGGGKGGQTTVLSCEPSEAPVGASVVCQAKDVADDCTLFFGNSPVEFTSNPDEGTVSFVVPPTLPGEKDIKVQCGDEGSRPVGKFSVPVPAGGGTTTPPAEGDTILPSGDPEGADGAGEGEGDEPARGLAGKLEKVGSHPLTVMNVNGFLRIESMRSLESNAHFSTYKVTFNVPGNPKAVYLSGNLFNRKASDDHLDDGVNPCGKLGEGLHERYLATQADGSKLNAGSALFEQNEPYLTGEVCGEGEDCRHGQVSVESNPWCKIAPKDAAGAPILNGTFYTRSLAQNGTVCLAVQSQDDQWTVDCDKVAAPPIAVTETEMDVRQDRPAVTVRFAYTNAEHEPNIMGSDCRRTGGAPLDHLGSGTYEGECSIRSERQNFGVSFQGVGEKNRALRVFTLELGDPSATFKTGTEPAYNTPGAMSLFYKVSRPYTFNVQDTLDGNPNYFYSQAGDCPWAKGVELLGRYVVDGSFVTDPAFRKIESSADADTQVKGYKDHDSVSWKLVVWDFNDNGTLAEVVSTGFPYAFDVVNFSGSWNYNYQYDGCDWGEAESGCCEGPNCRHDSVNNGAYGCHNYRVKIDMGWAGQNVQSVTATCTGKGESKKTIQSYLSPNGSDFSESNVAGSWSETVGGEGVTCDFDALMKNGGLIRRTYAYVRGEGVCDGPDLGCSGSNGFNDCNPDHNDAGLDD